MVEDAGTTAESRANIAEQLILTGFTLMLALNKAKKITQWRMNNFSHTAQVLMKELQNATVSN